MTAPPLDDRRRLSASEWKLTLALAAVQFAHWTDLVTVMPLEAHLSGDPGISPGQFGLLVSAYGIAAGCAGFLAGPWLDRFDRRAVLAGLCGGFVACNGVCAFAPDYWSLLGGRAASGAVGGLMTATALAILGDAVRPAARGAGTAILMCGFSLATVLGVPAGLCAAEWSATWRAPFCLLAGAGAGSSPCSASWPCPP
jgi:predicted MFS family arabinose efflux permease